MVFQCINIRQVPKKDLANVNAWKTMFDPYITYTVVLHLPLSGQIQQNTIWRYFHPFLT